MLPKRFLVAAAILAIAISGITVSASSRSGESVFAGSEEFGCCQKKCEKAQDDCCKKCEDCKCENCTCEKEQSISEFKCGGCEKSCDKDKEDNDKCEEKREGCQKGKKAGCGK